MPHRGAQIFAAGAVPSPDRDVDDADRGPAVKRPAKPRYDDAIPDFDAKETAGVTPPADEPAAPDKADSTPPGQGAAGTSVLKIGEIKARQGRDALMAYSESLSIADRKILAANLEHLKALYPK